MNDLIGKGFRKQIDDNQIEWDNLIGKLAFGIQKHRLGL
jgi:hypothetical protein